MTQKTVNLLSRARYAFFAVVIAGSLLVFNQPVRAVSTGLEATAGEAGLKPATGAVPLEVIVANIIRNVLSLVGVFFLILMIYAGFLWMTAGGNEEKVKKAKSLIVSSIIGMIIIFGAYVINIAITDWVLSSTGAYPSNPPAPPTPTPQ